MNCRTFEPSNIDPPDLNQLASFISATAGAGMQWFPDPELEKFVRDIARLPEMTDETVDFKQELFQQQQAMEFAQSQMQVLGMKQKAEMTAQGLTPEQAQIHSETPDPRTAQMQAEQAQQQAMATNQPPPEDPNADKQHQREKEKLQLGDKTAAQSHSREKEKLRLQDTLANRDHSDRWKHCATRTVLPPPMRN
jgi:hypothetical protein